MKRNIAKAAWPVLALTLAAATANAGQFVTERPEEFHVAADWNGDGNLDFAIIEKASGLYRPGVSAGGSTFVVGEPRPSGLSGITGAAAGPLLNPTRDALVLASPTTNRLHLFDPVPTATQLHAVYAAGVGPSQVAVMDIPGTGQAQPGEDLVSLALWDGFGVPRLRQLRNSAGSVVPVSTTALADGGSQFNPVRIRPALPQMLGLMAGDVSGDRFSIYATDADSGPTLVAEAAGLPSGSRYGYGDFDGAFNDFFFYVPGGTSVLTSRAAFDGGGYQLGIPVDHTLAVPIGQLSVISGTPSDLVAVVVDGGGEVRIYSYTAAGGFSLVQAITAAAGEGFTGVLPSGGGGIRLLGGDAGGGLTLRASSFTWTGSGFEEANTLGFPAAKSASSLANVFQFDAEPFVANGAKLLRTGNRLDWTSDFALSGAPGDTLVVAENLISESAGLGSPAAVNLGAAHPSTTHGLVNQIHEAIAVFAYDPVAGDVAEWISIDPPGGSYENAVLVSLQARSATTSIFYRTGGGPFIFYSSPVALFQDSSFEFYGREATGELSPIRSAEFEFSLPPESQDGDDDGVPDFVEIEAGTIADVSDDFDGDGFSDAQELISGTDPADPASTPPGARAESEAALRIDVTPRPYDGFALAEALAADGVALRAYDADGVFLAYGKTVTGLAPLSVVPFEPFSRFGLVATEKHFEIDTLQADKHLGRELVGVVPFVAAIPPADPFEYDPSDPLITNAANWVAGASPVLFPVPAPVTLDLDRFHLLKLVLFECLIGEAFAQRGSAYPDPVSLTPFREIGEAGLAHPGLDALRALELPDPNGSATSPPAFLIADLYTLVESAVDAAAPPPGMASLRDLVTEMYALSSSQNNQSPATYPLPLDALRGFAKGGALAPPYDSEVSLGAADLAAATAEVAAIKASLAARPVVTLSLEVPPAGAGQSGPVFEDCSILQTLDGVTSYALIDGEGLAFPLPTGFMLEPGSRASVTAFTDRGPVCGLPSLEVISVGVQFVPTPSAADGDGNLLADAWEELFFGQAGITAAFDSPDGSGYSALQQFLEGSDPTDPNSVPASAVMDLSLPEMSSQFDTNGDIVITWQWGNDTLAPRMAFEFSDSPDLNSFHANGVNGTYLGGGQWVATIPDPGSIRYFFSATMSLATGP